MVLIKKLASMARASLSCADGDRDYAVDLMRLELAGRDDLLQFIAESCVDSIITSREYMASEQERGQRWDA